MSGVCVRVYVRACACACACACVVSGVSVCVLMGSVGLMLKKVYLT